MEKRYGEFQKMIASAYLLLVLAVLPLYMKDGFYLLADAKYLFFRNISMIFLILWLLAAVFHMVWGQRLRGQIGYSLTDCFVSGFALISLMSYLFSDYKDTAFTGYYGWYMGLLTQLFFVGGYFLVSRWCGREKMISVIVWFSVFAVCLLGVLNRQGYDPLGMFRDMDWWDWNRRNLLSTIGNINWYCSYLAVTVPLLLYCFWAGEGWKRIPAGVAAYVGIGAIFLQGSASGYAALAAMYAVLLFGSLKETRLFVRFLETALLVPLFCFWAWLIQMDLILPFDMEPMVGKIYTPLWGIPLGLLAAGTGVLWVVYRRTGKDYLQSGRVLKAAVVLGAAICVAGVLIFAGCQISDSIWKFFGNFALFRFDDQWGSGRGQLWTAVWNGFRQSDLVQKLYGAGPDCFARYFYEAQSLDLRSIGQWEDAIYANAHNEWLNMLINEGILGAAAYLGIFLAAFARFRKRYRGNRRMMAGMMAIGAYLANQFFSFGQVVSTPFIFLVIAVCENECRRMEAGKEDLNGRK